MSLPPAPKDISNKPAPGSVVDPVNKEAKDADVDRKLRIYGVIKAFRLGRLPTNTQIDKALQFVLDNEPVEVGKLSPDGKKLVQDVRDIVETARVMVHQKNDDELLQQFIWHTRAVDREAVLERTPDKEKEGLPVDKDKLDTDAQQAVQHLRTLLSLVLTNSEVRKLLSDFSLIGRDLFSTGLQKAAETIAPPKEQLAQVDEPGPQDEFVSEGGRRVGLDETPVLEARVPGTDTRVKQHPQEDEMKIKREGEGERSAGEVKQALGGEKEKMKEGAKREGGAEWEQGGQGRDVGASAARGGLNNTDTSVLETTARGVAGDEGVDRAKGEARDVKQSANGRGEQEAKEREAGAEGGDAEVERKKGGIMGRMRDFKDNLGERVPQEHRERIERGKKVLTERFPEERREQFIYRGKKVIIECQKHEDYQEAIRWLLSYVEEYAKHTHGAVDAHKEEVRGVTQNEGLNRALAEIRTLLERFANGQSMDGILDAFSALRDDAQRDKELRDWFGEVDAYIHKVLLDPGYVLEDECNNQARRLRDGGRRFYDDKYKEHFDRLFSSIGDWFKAMGEDPTNKRFGEDWARLTRDLLFDSEGGLKFKKELWNDIRKVILPQLIQKVGYIPIPRIEYTDDNLDLVVENLTLSGRNLFPNVVSLEAHNFVRFSPYAKIPDEGHHRFTLTFGQVQADMRDVAFYYKSKTGVLRFKDSGLMDVVLGGEGLTATVVLVSAGKDRTSVFQVEDVHVKVDSLKFSIRDANHEVYYKIFKPIATGLIKKQIQRAVTDTLRTALEYVDGQLVRVRDSMESARAEEGEGRAQALQDLFKRTKEEGSIKTSTSSTAASQSHSQFKVVSNKRDSLLSSAGHPSGWVNRTAEKDALAAKGEDWRSEAFDIKQ